MKTSTILIILILFNTSALISEQLVLLIEGINIWYLLALEIILLIGYYINKNLKDLKKISEVDVNGLNVFVVKSKQ